MTPKNLIEFKFDLGAKESSGNYRAKNSLGYIGKYQMGEQALIDAGYYKKPSKNYNNDWSGQFTGKDGVYSENHFLLNASAQENALDEYLKKQWGYLKGYNAQNYLGKKINGIEITQSGLLAGAHNHGQKDTGRYLSTNGAYIPIDANGVSIEDNLKRFAGYDVSDITGILSGKRAYTLNELVDMPKEEFAKNQDEILHEFVMKRTLDSEELNQKLQSGEVIYIQPYTKEDGTKVKGHYRYK